MKVVFRISKDAPLIAVNMALMLLLAALLWLLWNLEKIEATLKGVTP